MRYYLITRHSRVPFVTYGKAFRRGFGETVRRIPTYPSSGEAARRSLATTPIEEHIITVYVVDGAAGPFHNRQSSRSKCPTRPTVSPDATRSPNAISASLLRKSAF